MINFISFDFPSVQKLKKIDFMLLAFASKILPATLSVLMQKVEYLRFSCSEYNKYIEMTDLFLAFAKKVGWKVETRTFRVLLPKYRFRGGF